MQKPILIQQQELGDTLQLNQIYQQINDLFQQIQEAQSRGQDIQEFAQRIETLQTNVVGLRESLQIFEENYEEFEEQVNREDAIQEFTQDFQQTMEAISNFEENIVEVSNQYGFELDDARYDQESNIQDDLAQSITEQLELQNQIDEFNEDEDSFQNQRQILSNQENFDEQIGVISSESDQSVNIQDELEQGQDLAESTEEFITIINDDQDFEEEIQIVQDLSESIDQQQEFQQDQQETMDELIRIEGLEDITEDISPIIEQDTGIQNAFQQGDALDQVTSEYNNIYSNTEEVSGEIQITEDLAEQLQSNQELQTEQNDFQNIEQNFNDTDNLVEGDIDVVEADIDVMEIDLEVEELQSEIQADDYDLNIVGIMDKVLDYGIEEYLNRRQKYQFIRAAPQQLPEPYTEVEQSPYYYKDMYRGMPTIEEHQIYPIVPDQIKTVTMQQPDLTSRTENPQVLINQNFPDTILRQQVGVNRSSVIQQLLLGNVSPNYTKKQVGLNSSDRVQQYRQYNGMIQQVQQAGIQGPRLNNQFHGITIPQDMLGQDVDDIIEFSVVPTFSREGYYLNEALISDYDDFDIYNPFENTEYQTQVGTNFESFLQNAFTYKHDEYLQTYQQSIDLDDQSLDIDEQLANDERRFFIEADDFNKEQSVFGQDQLRVVERRSYDIDDNISDISSMDFDEGQNAAQPEYQMAFDFDEMGRAGPDLDDMEIMYSGVSIQQTDTFISDTDEAGTISQRYNDLMESQRAQSFTLSTPLSNQNSLLRQLYKGFSYNTGSSNTDDSDYEITDYSDDLPAASRQNQIITPFGPVIEDDAEDYDTEGNRLVRNGMVGIEVARGFSNMNDMSDLYDLLGSPVQEQEENVYTASNSLDVDEEFESQYVITNRIADSDDVIDKDETPEFDELDYQRYGDLDDSNDNIKDLDDTYMRGRDVQIERTEVGFDLPLDGTIVIENVENVRQKYEANQELYAGNVIQSSIWNAQGQYLFI